MATLKYLSQYFSTTLNVGGGIDDTQTTGIVLQSVSGVTITKPGQICVSYSDPLDTGVAEWIDYTSINGSNELVGVTRGREGYAAKTHLQNATVAFVMSASHHNDVVDLLNGTEAGIKVKTALYDANGNEVIKTPATPSAVNEVTVTNSATGNAVQLSATGGDTNIDLKLVPKGTGALLDKNGDALAPNHSMSRQAIINGNFDVWQRGVTFATCPGVKYYADRWAAYDGGGASETKMSRQDGTGVYGSYYCARFGRVASSTSTTGCFLGQPLESLDSIKFRSKKLTLSFWARKGANFSATSDLLVGEIMSGTATDGPITNLSTSIASVNCTLTTSWQKFTCTTTNVVADTVTQLAVRIKYTGTGTAGAADYFEITQVQLCAGDVALPFQPKSEAEEQKACERYAVKIGGDQSYSSYSMAFGASTTVARAFVTFPTKMRSTPALTTSGTAAHYQIFDGSGAVICNAEPVITATTNTLYGVQLSLGFASGVTANRPYVFSNNNTASGYLLFTAEL